ncbi:MAG: PEP-CTERM system TPR-repeat protein PrsT [Rubrivivax sp.]|nr:PEP-CTERM system TPR-repeat protein PrsT [Rubrivivax sp.]
MPVKHLPRAFAPVLLALAAAALVACGGDSPDKLLGSAKELLAKDDPKAAVIQIKNVLQADGNNAEARFLLGKAMLASGDAPSASLELRKALDLRHPEAAVVPELARAMFIEGQYQKLTEQFGQTSLSDPLADADLKSTLAMTYGSMGRRDQAQTAVAAALKAMPDYGPAKVFEARLQADTGDLDGALAAVDKQISRTPQDHDAWQLKGDLLNYGKRDPDKAIEAYKQAVAVKPNFVPAHSALITLLLGKQDLKGAREQVLALQKVLPNHPQTAYFAGNVALLAKEYDKAREVAQALLRVAPDNPRILQLAGAVEFEKKAFLQAESFLAKALQKAPEQDISRRMLTLTYLQMSQPAKALATLQPLLDRPNPPAAVYSLAAQAHLQAGDINDAEAAFAKASQLNPDDKRAKTALAISKLLKGNNDAGMAELQTLAAADDSTTADLPLIGALVRKKDYAGAMKAIDALEKKLPGKPIAANLRARVLMQQGKKDEAKVAFEQALKADATFYPATSALAQLALIDGKPDEAKRLLDEAMKADPRNMQALLASARLKAGTGAPREEIIKVFTDAIQQNGSDPAPRLALINYQLANKDFKAALELGQAATAALPNNTDILEALGRAQAASGDTNQALATFNKLAQLLPQSPLPYLRLADVQWAAKNRDGAMQSLKRALVIAPDNLQAQRAVVDAYLADNKTTEAIGVAKDIQKQRPTQDVGFLIEGGIEASLKRWDRALEVYNGGLKAAPNSTELATRVHVALTAAKQEAAADKHATDWLKAHPRDAEFQYYLGDFALAARNLPQAELRYREVLKLQPENALALNNVAWLMATAKKPGSVVMAEKANALLPNRPVIMDTLALALAAEGQAAKGVEVMKKAMALENTNPQLRFNLAKLLIEAGDKAGAKTELTTLSQLGTKFPRQGEVAALLKTL